MGEGAHCRSLKYTAAGCGGRGRGDWEVISKETGGQVANEAWLMRVV